MDDESLDDVAAALRFLGRAIVAPGAPYQGRDGARVESLTEAVIYCADAMFEIAGAVGDVAEAIRETKREGGGEGS